MSLNDHIVLYKRTCNAVCFESFRKKSQMQTTDALYDFKINYPSVKKNLYKGNIKIA